MRICFLLPHSKIAGGITVMLTYAREMTMLGHDVTIVVREVSRLSAFTNTLTRRRPTWFPSLPPSVSLVYGTDERIKAFVDGYQGDAIVADAWHMAGILMESATKAKRFHIIQHDERLYHGERSAIERVYASSLHKIVVATWLRDMLKSEFNKDATVIVNSFDREIFLPTTKVGSTDTVRILTLDHSYAWKGTKEAIALCMSLKEEFPRLSLVGFGARETENRELFDEYHFEETGKRLASVYASADIYLCASWDEGFGLPSLEAMACGTALVTYDNGGSRDFAYDGRTAFVATRQDTVMLRGKLREAIIDTALRARIASQGCAYAHEMPTWNEEARAFVKAIETA